MSTKTLVGTPDPEPQPPQWYGYWTLSTGPSSSVSNSTTQQFWYALYNPS
jgi:hypothetical protein